MGEQELGELGNEELAEFQQAGMERLYQKQQLALQRVCPCCFGNLMALDLCRVGCLACELEFPVDEILKGVTPE